MADADGRLARTLWIGLPLWFVVGWLSDLAWEALCDPGVPDLTDTGALVIGSVLEVLELTLIVALVAFYGMSRPLLAVRPWKNRWFGWAIGAGFASVALAAVIPAVASDLFPPQPQIPISIDVVAIGERPIDAGAQTEIRGYIQMTPEAETPLIRVYQVDAWVVTILWFLCGCFITPIVEEILYRGWAQSALIDGRLNPHIAIALVSILFGAAHPDFLGAAASGLIFGYLRHYSGTLAAPIIAHALHNAVVGIVVLLVWGPYEMAELI